MVFPTAGPYMPHTDHWCSCYLIGAEAISTRRNFLSVILVKPMAREVLVLRVDPIIFLLLNGHVVKLPLNIYASPVTLLCSQVREALCGRQQAVGRLSA